MLVIQAPTLSMHDRPKIQRELARAYERDAESAKAEFGAEFRDGISDFVTVEVVRQLHRSGVGFTRAGFRHTRYNAFIDPAGGSGQDSFTLAIGHRSEDGLGILDHVAGIAPPFSPEAACAEFAALLKLYGVSTVTGDNYAAEWRRR